MLSSTFGSHDRYATCARMSQKCFLKVPSLQPGFLLITMTFRSVSKSPRCVPCSMLHKTLCFEIGRCSRLILRHAWHLRPYHSQLPSLVQRLRAVPADKIVRMRGLVLWARDYFVYKDMFNPNANLRRELLASGRPKQVGPAFACSSQLHFALWLCSWF